MPSFFPNDALGVLAAGALLAAEPSAGTVVAARRLAYVLVAALLLAVIAMTGFLLLRSMQRARQRMMRKQAQPTQWVDAWKMHKVPEVENDETDEPE